MMRVNRTNGFFTPAGGREAAFAELVPEPGRRYCAAGTAFRRDNRLPCTLTALWEPGYKEPWLLLTDEPPESAEPATYGLRA